METFAARSLLNTIIIKLLKFELSILRDGFMLRL